jgi:hypothetical protein
MKAKGLDETPAVTGVTGPRAALAGAPGGASPAERQRRSRARRRAEIAQRRVEAAREPLALLLAEQAERDLAMIEAQLTDDTRGLALAERTLEGAKAVILRLYGVPLLRLAETAMAPPELLAKRLECSRLEAAKLAADAQRELLDRLHGKAAPVKGAADAPSVAVQLNVTPGVAAALNLVADQRVNGEAEGGV